MSRPWITARTQTRECPFRAEAGISGSAASSVAGRLTWNCIACDVANILAVKEQRGLKRQEIVFTAFLNCRHTCFVLLTNTRVSALSPYCEPAVCNVKHISFAMLCLSSSDIVYAKQVFDFTEIKFFLLRTRPGCPYPDNVC
jgi:hypothetical protein